MSFGMNVPSINVVSLSALRVTEANARAKVRTDSGDCVRANDGHTEADTVDALRLLQETVDSPQVMHCRLGPALTINDSFGLFPQNLDTFRICGQVV